MTESNDMLEIAKTATKEVAKDIYADVGESIVKPTGELIGLVPRAVKAALLPLEKWVLQREYNLNEIKKSLAQKLENVPPENIQSPEAHIAVPAIQYMSYCMDNKELRDMYANLLANSMNSVVKNGVHPGFVEIIKQLCPDEAKILRYLSAHPTVPTVTLRYEREKGHGIDIIKNFSLVGELSHCENPLEVNLYFDNLIRLGLLEGAPPLSSLTDKTLYEPLKKHPYIQANTNPEYVQATGNTSTSINEGFMRLTDYGKAFCKICLSNAR